MPPLVLDLQSIAVVDAIRFDQFGAVDRGHAHSRKFASRAQVGQGTKSSQRTGDRHSLIKNRVALLFAACERRVGIARFYRRINEIGLARSHDL